VSDELAQRKRALRADIKSRLAAIDAGAWAEASARLTHLLLARPEVTRARAALAFFPIEREIDLRDLASALIARGVRLALPRVDWTAREMRAIEIQGPADVRSVRAGGVTLTEPAGEREIAPEDLDLVLAPGLAFDAQGGRLGRGAGFYDRFLARCPRALRVGAGLELQVLEAVPMGPGDVPLHAVVTDRRWIPVECGSG
jgi:5-formyltetrahydrofolate cyclo-ligase